MRARLTPALAACAAVALTACSTSSGDSATGSHRPAPYPSRSATAIVSASTAPSGESAAGHMLVTVRDLGRGFVSAQPDAPAALPCTPNDPTVDALVHHIDKGEAVFVNDLGGVQISEQIYVYGSIGDAQRHESIDDRGLGCAQGRFGSTLVTVSGPIDLHGRLGEYSDSAQAWGVKTARFSGAMVAVRIHALVVQFAVVAETGAQSSVDARQIVAAGVHKVLAVLATTRR